MAGRQFAIDHQSKLQINVFDGTRRPLADGTDVLYRIVDGNQKKLVEKEVSRSSLTALLPFYDNFGDNYTVLVYSDGYRQAGFTPVRLSPQLPATLDLMLIPENGHFNFAQAGWDAISEELPFLAQGVSNAVGRSRYEDLMEEKPACLAALFNITTAMSQIHLPVGTPLDYLKSIRWDESLAQDRFFAWCDPQLLAQVRIAASQGLFTPEIGSAFFHPGATASWKQVQFGEANVQLTFHEGKTAVIDGVSCIQVEPDIDYYKDVLAHALLEVLPNALSGLTNPETVYVLRWIAGRHAGIPEFNPPFSIVK